LSEAASIESSFFVVLAMLLRMGPGLKAKSVPAVGWKKTVRYDVGPLVAFPLAPS